MLSSQHYLLRKFVENDLPNIFKGLSHPDVIRYYGISFNSLEETKLQLAFFEALEKNHTGIWWAICSPDNQQFYGGIGFNSYNGEDKSIEIGFWLLPEYWGQGVLHEIMPVACQHVVEYFDIHRIEAHVETGNEKSKNLLLKNGFIYDRLLKDCEEKNGELISLEVYVLHFSNPHLK